MKAPFLGGLALCPLFVASAPTQAIYPQRLLDALDPVRMAARSCGSVDSRVALARSLAAASALVGPASRARGAMPLYSDLDTGALKVTTANEMALRYVRQGLMLTYGFNHAAAVRSFREAQRQDPDCAMCFWGEALALGPNINAPMDDRDVPSAMAALKRAVGLAGTASPPERGLIEALSLRYSDDPKADRAALDAAYADAMTTLAARYPASDEVAVLAAEAVMDTTPWNYWEADKVTPVGRSMSAVHLLETVLQRNPSHPQATHLYIHAMENSRDPARAEAAADSLREKGLRNAGHLIHMPAHIYGNIGRHADSIRANVAAAKADEAYLRQSDEKGLYRFGYYPHNIHFIVMSAQYSGDMPTAIREAKRLRGVLDPDTSAQFAWIQVVDAAPFTAMAQFAQPAQVLAMPPPDARLPYARAIRHYARALAQVQLGNKRAFESEIAAMNAYKSGDALAPMVAQGVPGPDLIQLAEHVARGRLAYREGRFDQAIAAYREAITIEAKIPYQEPPYWYFPVRQALGAALLRAGRTEEASEAFRGALLQSPRNGWALYGLAQSEQRLGHGAEAAAARQALEKAWLGDRQWLKLDRL